MSISDLYKQDKEQKRNDTYIFEVKIKSTWRNSIKYKIKIDLEKLEDYSTAWERLKQILRISYPSVGSKQIRLIETK